MTPVPLICNIKNVKVLFFISQQIVNVIYLKIHIIPLFRNRIRNKEFGIKNLALQILILRYFCLSINWDDDFIKWSARNPIVRKNWRIIMAVHGFMIGPSFVSNLLELIVNIFLKSASFETFELIAGIVERQNRFKFKNSFNKNL